MRRPELGDSVQAYHREPKNAHHNIGCRTGQPEGQHAQGDITQPAGKFCPHIGDTIHHRRKDRVYLTAKRPPSAAATTTTVLIWALFCIPASQI